MFKMSISTYETLLYSGLVQMVILPTEAGEITIMDFHQPILSRLHRGIISIDKKRFFRIKDGIACFNKGELRAIVE